MVQLGSKMNVNIVVVELYHISCYTQHRHYVARVYFDNGFGKYNLHIYDRFSTDKKHPHFAFG